MKEHMDVPIDTSNMSEQELQFHYFKMHDSDGNNKLGKLKSFSLIVTASIRDFKIELAESLIMYPLINFRWL